MEDQPVTYTKKPRERGPLDYPTLKPHPSIPEAYRVPWSDHVGVKRRVDVEVRSVSSTGGEKGVKPQRYSLVPTQAVALIAEHFAKGAAKYADHNWRKGYEWSKSYDALQRHLAAFWSGEDVDAETGSHHLAAAGFHVLALLTYTHEDKYAQFDDRYKG